MVLRFIFLTLLSSCSQGEMNGVQPSSELSEAVADDAEGESVGLLFKKPKVGFLGGKNKEVKISADTAFFSSGMIRFEGGVKIAPVSEVNIKKIISNRGTITSKEPVGTFQLAPNTDLDKGSEIQLSGDVTAYLKDGRIESQSLLFQPKLRALWSDDTTIYSGQRGTIRSKKGFSFDSAQNSLQLKGETFGVFLDGQ